MTAERITPPSLRRTSSWAGRASHHRRQQVRSRGCASLVAVENLWESLVDVLRAIDSPSSALLCTADGAPLASYGLSRTDLPRVSLEAGTVFAARVLPGDVGHVSDADEVETIELTAGERHTVIALVPVPQQGDHLLAVSAEAVSPPLLEAWTRRAAEDLRRLLAAQP